MQPAGLIFNTSELVILKQCLENCSATANLMQSEAKDHVFSQIFLGVCGTNLDLSILNCSFSPNSWTSFGYSDVTVTLRYWRSSAILCLMLTEEPSGSAQFARNPALIANLNLGYVQEMLYTNISSIASGNSRYAQGFWMQKDIFSVL